MFLNIPSLAGLTLYSVAVSINGPQIIKIHQDPMASSLIVIHIGNSVSGHLVVTRPALDSLRSAAGTRCRCPLISNVSWEISLEDE